MKFSIVRTDNKNVTHLSLKTPEWLMERIQSDTKAGDVSRLRQHIAHFGNVDYYEPLATMSMIYPLVELLKTENGLLSVVAFNGLVPLHVSGLLQSEDLRAVKEAAKQLPMTFAAFVGADGRSVDILVAVEDANANLNPNPDEAELNRFCQRAYETALCVYGGLLPHPIERQAVSVRSCFPMTLDEAPYFNPSPTPLKLRSSLGSEPDSSLGLSLGSGLSSGSESDMDLYAIYEEMYQRASEEANDKVTNLPEKQQFEAYITLVAQRLCRMDVPEEETFLHLSNHHIYRKEYNEDVFRSIVSAVYAEEKPARRHQGSAVNSETRRLINFLNTRYVFRHNTVMGYTEYRPNNTWANNWQPCDESALNGMAIEARLANFDVREKDIRRYVYSNKIRPCDPISDFLSDVSDKWDGTTDHIGMLARCVSCDVPQWEQWFRKWFLAMVAQWLLPHQEYGNSVVPLLISPQGDGKTTFCRNLLPKELRWGFMENLDISEKRQTLQAMHNFLLINLDEFNQIPAKLQEGFLKNVIQLPSVKLKRPYGKHVEEFRRYASFIATTNETNVLSDPTGSRRFICVPLTAPIDTSYKPNYEGLYGQAYTIVMHHREQWWFTPEEVKAVMEHNRRYEQTPPAIQYFNEFFTVAEDESAGEWLSPTAIYDHLRRIAGSGLKANGVATFGRYLNKIPNIRQRRTKNGMQYLVCRK